MGCHNNWATRLHYQDFRCCECGHRWTVTRPIPESDPRMRYAEEWAKLEPWQGLNPGREGDECLNG